MSFVPLPVDAIVPQAVITIDEPHSEIHQGDAFRFTDSVTIGSGSSQDYMITTPNTTNWAHMTMMADGTAITSFFLYEATDKNGTTLQTVFNANRNSASAATTTIRKGTSGGTTDGTLIAQYSSGTSSGNSKTSSTVDHRDEFILKQNTKYIFRITSGTNGNLCNVTFSWYEHVSGSNM